MRRRIWRLWLINRGTSASEKGNLKLKIAVNYSVVGLVISYCVCGGLNIKCYGCSMSNDWLQYQVTTQALYQILRNSQPERKLTCLIEASLVWDFAVSSKKLMLESLLRRFVNFEPVVFHYCNNAANFEHVFVAVLLISWLANFLPKVDLNWKCAALDWILDCILNNLEQNLVVEVPISI
jgi:hypothetical protein